MTPELANKLARLKNRATRYELAATNGTHTVLAGYARKGRSGLLSMIRKNADAWTTFAQADSIQFAKRAADGATLGKWTIRFTGRTQREAIIAAELTWFKELMAA